MEESRSITLTAASNEQTTAVQSSRKRMCCEELPYGCSTTTPQRSSIDIKSRNSPSSPQSIDQTRLQCSFTQKCTMTFSRKYHLTRHITRYHSPKTDGTLFSCRYCGPHPAFQTRFEIEQHYQTCHPNQNDIYYICMFSDCQKKYSKKEHLKRHQRACGHLNVEKQDCSPYMHSCDLCQATFQYKHGLERHMRRSHFINELKSHQCAICLLTFRKKHSLQAHMFIHTGVIPFPCENCDQAYMKRYQLVKHHEAKHAGTSLPLEMVGRARGQTEDTSQSISMATSESDSDSEPGNGMDASSAICNGKRTESETPTQSSIYCQLCCQAFRFKKNFRAHLQTHYISLDDRKQFQCPYLPCEKRYTTKSNLKTHIQALHDPTRGRHFNCPVEGCTGVFAYRHTLQQHLKRIHAREQDLVKSRRKSSKKARKLTTIQFVSGSHAVV